MEDERRALREELEKYRRENDSLRKSFQLNSNKTDGSDERDKAVTASVDSGVGTHTAGMSSTFSNSHTFQLELNDSKERERKLEEKIHLLRKVREKKTNNLVYNLTKCFCSNLSHRRLKSTK